MNIKDYSKNVERTYPDLNNDTMNNLHMILGLVTEVGELADTYKKYIAYGKELDRVNLMEEAGDILWYLTQFCNINYFDLESIMEININKLRTRYPEKFDSNLALSRDLDKERLVLEKGSLIGTSELQGLSEADVDEFLKIAKNL